MLRPQARQQPPEAVISALTRAGLSLGTVLSMEAWKAQEVLDLLRSVRVGEAPGRTSVVAMNPSTWPEPPGFPGPHHGGAGRVRATI
jgi:hypothetical protein